MKRYRILQRVSINNYDPTCWEEDNYSPIEADNDTNAIEKYLDINDENIKAMNAKITEPKYGRAEIYYYNDNNDEIKIDLLAEEIEEEK